MDPLFEDVETFILAANLGYADELKECIAADTHLKDTRGSALYGALTHGHIDCVIVLLSVLPKDKILNKHYYAAGLAGPAKAPTLYNLISPEQTTYLQQNIPNHDIAKMSHLLYHAAKQGAILLIRGFLEHHIPVEAKHFYAAGRYFDRNKPETETTCKRMFELLKSFQANKPLRDDFYTEEEERIHQMVEHEARETLKPSMA